MTAPCKERAPLQPMLAHSAATTHKGNEDCGGSKISVDEGGHVHLRAGELVHYVRGQSLGNERESRGATGWVATQFWHNSAPEWDQQRAKSNVHRPS